MVFSAIERLFARSERLPYVTRGTGGGLGEFLGPGRHDGTAKYYYWKYFADCQCLHYYGPRRTFP